MNSLKSVLKNFSIYAKSPYLISLWVMLGLIIVVLAANFFFIPLYLIVISSIVFTGIGIFMTINHLRLARLTIETELSKQHLNSVLDNLGDGVIIYDQNFKILAFNNAAEEIFHVERTEVVGTLITPALVKNTRLKLLTETLFPSIAPSITQLSEPNEWPQRVNISFEEPRIELQTTLHRILDDKKRHLGFLKIVKDWSREKSILQSKDEFINIAAHQLRTPLTAIGWALENIQKLTLGDSKEIQETVTQALEISHRALKITNDLLDASKIEEGRFGYVFEESDLITLLEQVVNSTLPVAKQYNVTIRFVTKEKKPLLLRLDPSRISTALLNLIDNAIKYNVKGGTVTMTLERMFERPFVKITIEDTGVGIPPDEVSKLFQKLYRGSNIAHLEPNGSGLGLYITKNIINRHGGAVEVSSALNRGSQFSITLPLFSQNPLPQKNEF